MDIYIDFDNTIYNTSLLKQKMLEEIAQICSESSNVNYESLLFEAKSLFNGEKIYNINRLCEFFAQKYCIDCDILTRNIDTVISNGSQFLYNDSVEFLKYAKANGHSLKLLTLISADNKEYQIKKINGANIKQYFDEIIITDKPKHTLNIDYQNSVFIDDNPSVLAGLYLKKPYQIFRICRQNNKYSNIKLPDLNIKSFDGFEGLKDYNHLMAIEK